MLACKKWLRASEATKIWYVHDEVRGGGWVGGVVGGEGGIGDGSAWVELGGGLFGSVMVERGWGGVHAASLSIQRCPWHYTLTTQLNQLQ